MSTMIMLSPFVCRALSRCSMSLVFADCSKATNQFLPFFSQVPYFCITKVFSTATALRRLYPTRRKMMEVRCEGRVRAHSILMCLEALPLSTPESTKYYWIEQLMEVLMYSYSQRYTKNQTKLWTSSHIQFCCAVCF